MIRIDHISFEFAATGEEFAYRLYADWDRFCRECFEKVVEECLSEYDKDKVLHEIEKLDLDLGSIPEEDFYREFSIRLKEELLKVLPSFIIPLDSEQTEKTGASRIANLLFYLEHGFPKTEWADSDFNLTEELKWVVSQHMHYTDGIVKLCLNKEYAMRRLMWQINDEKILVCLYSATLSNTSIALREKRRFLEMLLEMNSGIPVRFIHETTDNVELKNMADLLDTLSVRRIMEKETEEHAEVDLPPYWHYLYEWLVRYYPFNGLVIFGSKGDFTRHLHHRLLTFIHKRNYSYYLSKTELTAGFLIEVFGTAYYIEVLNAICELQPHHADGSPLYDGYLNRELYSIFLQLSLLRIPVAEEEKKEKTTSGKEMPVFPTSGVTVSALITALAEVADDVIINQLLASVSFAVVDIALKVKNYLRSHAQEISWLAGISESRLAFVLRRSILLWIGNRHSARPEPEGIRQLMSIIYREITGNDKEEDIEQLSTELYLSEKDRKEFPEKKETFSLAVYIRRLKIKLEDKSVPEAIKRRMLALFLEQSEDSYVDTVLLLHEQGLLKDALSLINQFVLEKIIRQLFIRINDTYKVAKMEDAEYYDMETALGLLLDAGQSPFGNKRYSLKQDFKEWKHHSEYIFNIVQTLLESRWNTDENFIGWLEDTEIAADNKQELLQKLVVEKPKEWISLLRKLPKESKEIDLMATCLPASRLLQGMAWTEFYQASVLSQTVEWLQRSADRFIFLTGSNILLSTALSKALLLYMQDKDTLSGRTLTESETLHKFFSYLYLAYTGKTEDYRNDADWVDLSDIMTTDLGTDSWLEIQEKEIADVLLFQETSDTVFSRNVFVFMERQPERLLAWLEKDADSSLIERIAATSDRMMLGQWIAFLSAASGFEHRNTFRQLMEWFDRISTGWASVSDTISVLLFWLRETNWRKQTPEQMEDYFITRLFRANTLHLPIERIADAILPENIRRRLLGNYIRFQPKELSDYIRQSVELNALPLDIWLEWLDINDWMRLATNLSLSRAELLRQTIDYLSESGQAKEADLHTALATCLINNSAEEWIYNNREETVRTFVQSLSALQKNTEMEKEDLMKLINNALSITAAEDYSQKEQTESPDILFISNAGLCLLTAWLPRLLELLGYLDKDKKDFKDTATKIRTVFLLQYLTCSEEKEYRETELAFNRLLVSLPMNIPLPESLALTDEEKQTAESMLAGVKANWQAMNGTSIKGFQNSFIMRTGRLEQQEERWLLTVDNWTLDILLDSVPWGFKQIRLPWLKKYIQVVWHDKQEF